MITQKQVLYRIDVLLEQALRETDHIKYPHTLDIQIRRIRAEIQERVAVQRKLEQEESLRERLCTPVSVSEAGRLVAKSD